MLVTVWWFLLILALFWVSETGQIWGLPGISWRTHQGNGQTDPFDWNWSYLGFLGIIWRTCGSKYRGGAEAFFRRFVSNSVQFYLFLLVIRFVQFTIYLSVSTRKDHVFISITLSCVKYAHSFVVFYFVLDSFTHTIQWYCDINMIDLGQLYCFSVSAVEL